MHIKSVETSCYRIPLPRTLSDSTHGSITHFQLVTTRIQDDEGAEGLGYCYTVGRGGVPIRWLIEADICPLLLGQDADQIEQLWQRMWSHLHYVGRGGLVSFAMSAVDIALWDLKARRANVPLWQLLGGTQNRVPVYAGGIDLQLETDELLAQADEFLRLGFRAIKMKVGRDKLIEDIDRVAAMREKLSPDVPLMVDANMAWSVEDAITAARELRGLDIYWLEEPTEPDDFAGHQRIAQESGIPIAAGENLHTHREFEMLLASQGAAFPEPDVANIGGITAWLRVAELAHGHRLPVTSHGVHDLHVHLLAAVPNASYLEFHGFGLDSFLAHSLEITDGLAVAPLRPGHGVDLDWDALRAHQVA